MNLELCQIRLKLQKNLLFSVTKVTKKIAAVSASRRPIGRRIRDSAAPRVYIVHADCDCCSDL